MDHSTHPNVSYGTITECVGEFVQDSRGVVPQNGGGGRHDGSPVSEWRNLEPTKNTWKWDQSDALVKSARENNITINAILMGSPPSSKSIHAFPMDNLDDWSNYVSSVVGRYKDSIRYWEVWNEGNGGFNDGKHTTTDYAKLAIATYQAAKKADPQARVGLTVASFDPAYLNQTILAMKKVSHPNSFDFLCIHPYEIADGLGDVDGEVAFLWMEQTLRDMLKSSAPERANAEIWITEVGHRIEKKTSRTITEKDAAKALAKIYTMSLAQKIACVQWFEAQDPIGEDQGFGLLNRDGSLRPSYTTLKTLTTHLGATPRYLGWLTMGRNGRGYGFVFDCPSGPILVAWMPSGMTDASTVFAGDVHLTDAVTSNATLLKSGQHLTLTDSPVLIANLPPDLVKQSQSNAAKPFPWGGDFSTVKTVSCQPGSPNANQGITQVGRAKSPTVTFPAGSSGILVQGDITHPVSLTLHPSFAKLSTQEYHIRATVRRIAAGNVGMNLLYEVAESQGRTPYANVGKWLGASASTDWQTHTWHVKDACFAKMWGYDIVLRPEQSVPFVIGKVEVSTEPFK